MQDFHKNRSGYRLPEQLIEKVIDLYGEQCMRNIKDSTFPEKYFGRDRN